MLGHALGCVLAMGGGPEFPRRATVARRGCSCSSRPRCAGMPPSRLTFGTISDDGAFHRHGQGCRYTWHRCDGRRMPHQRCSVAEAHCRGRSREQVERRKARPGVATEGDRVGKRSSLTIAIAGRRMETESAISRAWDAPARLSSRTWGDGHMPDAVPVLTMP